MNVTDSDHQILISGVGGQGVLFVTRLLAEAAINRGLNVFTSETHGMAQRGGSVISHLKVGEFTSPLILPGYAGGLIALKAEGVAQYRDYLRSGAWIAVNSAEAKSTQGNLRLHCCDADQLVRSIETPRALNLVMLGFAVESLTTSDLRPSKLFCSLDDILAVLERRLSSKPGLLQSSIKALEAGAACAAPS